MSVIVKSHKLSKYMVYYYAGVRTTFCLLFDTILCKEKVFEAHNYSCCVSSWRGGGGALSIPRILAAPSESSQLAVEMHMVFYNKGICDSHRFPVHLPIPITF